MTQKERLVELLYEYDSVCFDNPPTPEFSYARELADYLLANGVIVSPCKVGDTVYIIPSVVNYDLNQQFGRQAENRVYAQVVDEIRLNLNGYYIVTTVKDAYAGAYHEVAFHDTWFLSSEEAEQALKEREK